MSVAISLRPVEAMPRAAAATRYRLLGGWRLLLALLVVVQHFQYLLADAARETFRDLGLGVIAVAVFFAISGFIVAEALAGFYAGRPLGFLTNRLLRVVPPYLAALALSVCVHAALWRGGRLVLWDYTLSGSPLDWRLVGGSIASLVPGLRAAGVLNGFEFIPFVWSLRVEMAFYLAAFAACLLPRRGFLLPWLFGLAGYGGFALFLARGWPGIGGDAPFFLLGVLTSWFLRRPGAVRGAVLLAGFAASLLGFAHWDQPAERVVAHQLPILACLLAGFLMLATIPVAAPRLRAMDRAFGALSYPLYLNHYVIGIALYDLVALRGPLVYAAGVVLSLGLAASMHLLAEAPLQRWRDVVRGQAL